MDESKMFEGETKKEITKEDYAKFREAWDILTLEEKEYLGGYYYTTDIEEKNKQLEQSAQEKLGKFGFSVGSSLSEYIDKFTDANYWTKEDIEDFKKKQAEQKK